MSKIDSTPIKKIRQEIDPSFCFCGVYVSTDIIKFKQQCEADDKDALTLCFSKTNSNDTLLMICSMLGLLEHVKFIVGHESLFRFGDNHLKYVFYQTYGDTNAITRAMNNNHMDIVDYLWNCGFSKDAEKLLEFAIRYQLRPGLVMYILEKSRHRVAIITRPSTHGRVNVTIRFETFRTPAELLVHPSKSMRDILENYEFYQTRDRHGLAISLLIARELCPDSPFHKDRLPFDLFRIIFRNECLLFIGICMKNEKLEFFPNK